MKILFQFILSVFISIQTFAQIPPIGQWRTHFSYRQAVDVVEAGDKIYCGTSTGLYFFDRDDNSLEALTKLNGLNDVETSIVAYSEPTSTLIVAYQNSNIDLLQNKTVYNVRDIFDKTIIGSKTINSIYTKGVLAYMACGFGIVVYDLEKREVKDTYFIGPNGGNMNIYQVTTDDTTIYAGTENGVMEAPLSSSNLADFRNWRSHDSTDNYPGGACKALFSFAGKLYGYINSSVYSYSAAGWKNVANVSFDARGIAVSTNRLLKFSSYGIFAYDENLNQVDAKTFSDEKYDLVKGLYDQEGAFWVIKQTEGLSKNKNGVSELIYPAGPGSSFARRLDFNYGRLVVAPGVLTLTYNQAFDQSGFYTFTNDSWKTINRSVLPELDGIFDLCVVRQHPANGHIFLGSYGRGVVEYADGKIVNLYNYSTKSTHSLQGAVSDSTSVRITGLAFDEAGQLWVSNWAAPNPVSVRTVKGAWKSFNFPGVFSGRNDVADIMVDQSGQKWVIAISRGILVFKEQPDGKLKYRMLTKGAGNGNLPSESSNVYAVKEDQEGRVWVGTDKGIVVFYSPQNVLSDDPKANFDAQPIKIVQEGLVQLLLETETVTAITIDGANRKWVGTLNGAWLFSDDGTKQLAYFNKDNSPLPSNAIYDISIDPSTGEVFFATEKGLMSYRGTATGGGESNTGVLVFPNPVRPGYTGLIAIRGLVQNANVKITDITGNLVYQTIADGGQATWDGKNFKGEKAATGVYLVFATNDDGTETVVEKILFVN